MTTRFLVVNDRTPYIGKLLKKDDGDGTIVLQSLNDKSNTITLLRGQYKLLIAESPFINRPSILKRKRKEPDLFPKPPPSQEQKKKKQDPFHSFKKRDTSTKYISVGKLNKAVRLGKLKDVSDFLQLRAFDLCKEVSKEDFLEKIGRGREGQVFSFGKDMDLKSIVIKKVNVTNPVFEQDTIDKKKFLVVDRFTQEMIVSSLVSRLRSKNKCFVGYQGYFFCPRRRKRVFDPNDKKIKEVIVPIKGYSVIERMEGVLGSYFKTHTLSFGMMKSIIFQIIFAVNTMQKFHKMVHYDMHYNNIGWSETSKDVKWLKFVWGENEYYLPNHGFIIRIFDFDLSYVERPFPVVTYHVFHDWVEGSNIKPEFKAGYDIGFIVGSLMRDFQAVGDRLLNQVEKNMEKLLENTTETERTEKVLANAERKARGMVEFNKSAKVSHFDVELDDLFDISQLFKDIVVDIYSIILNDGEKRDVSDFTRIDPIVTFVDEEGRTRPKFNRVLVKNEEGKMVESIKNRWDYILADDNKEPVKKDGKLVLINENVTNNFFFGMYKRPTERLAKADLTGLLFGKYFDSYKKTKRTKDVTTIAKI